MSRVAIVAPASQDDDAPSIAGATGIEPPVAIAGIVRALGHEARVVRVTWSSLDALAGLAGQVDLALDLCEGLGRDGRPGVEVREALRAAGVRVAGAPALGVALALDKALARRSLAAAGVRVPDGVVVSGGSAAGLAAEVERARALGPPWVIKPRQGAGSHGLEVVVEAGALARRVGVVVALHGAVVVEALVPGLEVTVPVIGDGASAVALPAVAVAWGEDVAPTRRVLDLAAKHDPRSAASAAWRIEPRLEPSLRAGVEATARAAHAALGLRGLSRVDLRLDAQGRPVVLEVNPDATLEPTVTRDEGGLLAASLRAAGRSWSWVIARLLEGATT